MAHAPKHPDNPCHASLPEAEHTPAKIWELSRRNDTLKKAVARLAQLDARAKEPLRRIRELLALGVQQGQPTPEARELEAECRRHNEAAFVAKRMLQLLGKNHPFAAVALEWLVPEPWFEVHHTVIAPGEDLTGKQWAPIKVIKLESGSTPDPNDKEHWQVFTAHGEFDAPTSRSLAGCAPMVRGPIIAHTIVEDSRLQISKINPIREWKDYYDKHGAFTLNDCWDRAPPGFKRGFCALWRLRDSRERNPLTGCRTDAPQEQEPDFFQNWRLAEALGSAAKTGQLKSDDLVASFRFDNLAENYRVFAFPTCIRTRTEARRLANWLFTQLAAGLPARESDSLLGSPQEWDMLLTYEDRRRQGDDHMPALRYTFDTLFLKLPGVREVAAVPPERTLDAVLQHRVAKKMLIEAESTRWHSWVDDFARINSPITNSGLIQLVFPRLEAALALPAKRRQRRLKR